MDQVQYGVLKHALDAASLRQDMLSSNIANVNTPGFKVNKVEFESLLSEASKGSGMRRTHSQHFGVSGVQDVTAQVKKRTNTAVKDNGNNVDIDYEMTELAANSLYYQALISQVNAKYSMFRTTLK